ncbi:MAG: hypothetical protein JW715_03310 [Sedimentisphaerales bacterium]|nr:hypothetical protein [Sedimentisphaerales bacterium]
MRTSANYPLKVITTGLIVLILLSLPLFWSRFICNNILVGILPYDARNIVLEPSGFVPEDIENDPNVEIHSYIRASNRQENTLYSPGIIEYFISRMPGGRKSNIYWLHTEDRSNFWESIYYDRKIGQIFCRYRKVEIINGEKSAPKEIQLYVGPEGVSDIPDKKLGRFNSPVVIRMWINMSRLILYDHQLRRFFNIDFRNESITKGPQLQKNDFHKPVAIGSILYKANSSYALAWNGPEVRPSDKDTNKGQQTYGQPEPIATNEIFSQSKYLFVLDATGRIDLLNTETLEFEGTAGRLPAPQTYFPSTKLVRQKDLLAYSVLPLFLSTDHKYKGMFVSGVNREGTALVLSVFDENGKQIRTEYTNLKGYDDRGRQRYSQSGEAVYFNFPWSSTITIGKYLLENLHPPILSILSYFTAYSFEAGSGHRALFILPNSFIAMKGRDIEGHYAERFIDALLLILPSIVLAIFLARRISKDATTIGLSKEARLFWIIGTIAFGLAAYITYRLTRPKITLVTCQNCGKLRRPDMARCHRCNSKWQVPELNPPLWRVID